jgi:hypothetical protein
MVRCDWAGTQEPDIQFSGWLQAEGVDQKQPLTVDVLATGRQEKTDIFILEFELPELQPGRYLLHLSAEDSATNTSSETASGFSIKSRAPGQS